MTDETLGSQISVTRRVKAAACLAPRWYLEEESHGGGARNFVVLVVEWRKGIKRQRRRVCVTWTTRWK